MSLNRPDPPPMGPVAYLLAMDRTTLTAALKPLERRGLVRNLAGPNRSPQPHPEAHSGRKEAAWAGNAGLARDP